MQRNTLQRQIILDAVMKLKTHPAIEEVYTEVQKKYPAISKTTVYRNLRYLAKNRVIRKILLQDGLERYDSHTEQHYHFKCNNCGDIFDINIEYLAGLDKDVHKKYGLDVDRHDVIFTGLCPKCGDRRSR